MLLQVAHPLVAAGVAEHSDYSTTSGAGCCGRCARSTRHLRHEGRGRRDRGHRAHGAHSSPRADEHAARSLPRGNAVRGRRPRADALGARDARRDIALGLSAPRAQPLAARTGAVLRGDGDCRPDLRHPGTVIPKSLGEFRGYFEAEIAGTTIEVTPRPGDRSGDPRRAAARADAVDRTCPSSGDVRHLPPRLRAEYGLQQRHLHALTRPLAARSVSSRPGRCSSPPRVSTSAY